MYSILKGVNPGATMCSVRLFHLLYMILTLKKLFLFLVLNRSFLNFRLWTLVSRCWPCCSSVVSPKCANLCSWGKLASFGTSLVVRLCTCSNYWCPSWCMVTRPECNFQVRVWSEPYIGKGTMRSPCTCGLYWVDPWQSFALAAALETCRVGFKSFEMRTLRSFPVSISWSGVSLK